MSRGPAEAVLFDFDGVLVDSGRQVELAWGQWADRHGISIDAMRAVWHGRQTEEVVRMLARELDPGVEAAWVEELVLTIDGGGTAIDEAVELYRRLAEGRRAIVTSARIETAQARIARQALPPPAALVTAGDVEAGKPAPDCYRLGARLLGLDPERCLVIEDAPAGIEAALAAGMTVIALTTTHPAQELAAAHQVIPPTELDSTAMALLAPGVAAL
ncbi:MAG TPA: HAD-IA family hydrolase [Solirubrobacterales bacterium]|nr:HAD-IA family hydrolase [Solirubrobacterales bacterium]